MGASWNVGYVPQSANMTCWAACIAMLVNFRDGSSLTDLDVAQQAGIDPQAGASDSDYPRLLQQFGLQAVYGSCMLPEGWDQLIGGAPTIVGITSHVVVAAATQGGPDTDSFQAYILDPAAGPGWWTFDQLEGAFELRANREFHMFQLA